MSADCLQTTSARDESAHGSEKDGDWEMVSLEDDSEYVIV